MADILFTHATAAEYIETVTKQLELLQQKMVSSIISDAQAALVDTPVFNPIQHGIIIVPVDIFKKRTYFVRGAKGTQTWCKMVDDEYPIFYYEIPKNYGLGHKSNELHGGYVIYTNYTNYYHYGPDYMSTSSYNTTRVNGTINNIKLNPAMIDIIKILLDGHMIYILEKYTPRCGETDCSSQYDYMKHYMDTMFQSVIAILQKYWNSELTGNLATAYVTNVEECKRLHQKTVDMQAENDALKKTNQEYLDKLEKLQEMMDLPKNSV